MLKSSAEITNVDLQLSGPSPIPTSLPQIGAQELGQFLESGFLGLAPSTDPNLTEYLGLFAEVEGLSGSYEITVDNASADRLLTISGGGSGAAFPIVDGPFFSFSGTAVAVPEPVGLPVCLLLGITLLARRGRGTLPV